MTCKLLYGRLAAALTLASLLWPAQPALAQFRQQAKLVGTGAAGNGNQGIAVALSADGSTAIVGGPSGSAGGAAWVFIRSGNTWTQQAKLAGNDAIGTVGVQQGTSVGLSADGNTAIVGGPGDNSNAGAAWIFIRSGTTWTQQAKLVGSGAVGSAEQGHSVALSHDGNTAVVGGPLDGSLAGAAWVFTRTGATWNQDAKVVGSGAIGNAEQGTSVTLSGDATTLSLGGANDNSNAGAVWVFIRCPGIGGWCQQAKLVGSGAVGAASQGIAVALSVDGNTAVEGGFFDDSAGAVWVFTRSGGAWSQQAKLVGSGASGNAHQGSSIALSGDGNVTLVGGPNDAANTGAVWVFTRSSGVWSQQGNKLVGTGALSGASQGISVALSCNTAIVGGPFDDGAGAAWVFTMPPTATHDFNGDCSSDVLWYNTAGGQIVNWLVNGGAVIGGGSPGSLPSPFAIVGQRDFNGDGYADILARNGTTGQVMVSLLNGSSLIGSGSPGSAGSPFSIAGTGDFNGDGMGDILWYNTASGQVVLWFLNGTSLIGGGSPGAAASPFAIVGTGDFNGDGFTDILWYNTSNGQVVIWFLNGTSLIGGGSPGSVASPFTIVGTGDFDGDGKSDILWYNTNTGQVVIWLLNGATVTGGGSPGSVNSPFVIAETGDFNSDGKSDILWYNTSTGQLVFWLLNGASIIGGASPDSGVSPWQVQGLNAD